MINVKPKELTVSKPTRQISKTLKMFFMIIQIIFSYDFGFIKYRSTRHKYIIKLCSAVIAAIFRLALMIRLGYEEEPLYFCWYSVTIIQNYLFIVILLIIPERSTFRKFLEHFLTIDSKLNMMSDNLNFKIYFWCVASSTCKILIAIIYCLFLDVCLKNKLTAIMFFIPLLSIEIPLVVLYIIFHATYVRLVALRKFMDDSNFEPKQTHSLYKTLIDSLQNIKNAFDPIFTLTVFVNIPYVMIIIYGVLKDMTYVGMQHSLKHVCESIIATSYFVSIFAPAITAGSLSSEVDKIKVILHDLLIIEEDKSKVKDVKRFISYIDARPFKFHVLSIIPLDGTFPVAVLNICVTYMIVTLQFTHIY